MSHPPSSITRVVRAGIAQDREHGAVVPPIHLTSTFAFECFGKARQFDYTRSGNPTRAQLADAIAELEHGAGAVVTSTGMSAVGLVLALTRPGDVVIAAHDCYGGTQRLLRALAGKGHFELVARLTYDCKEPGELKSLEAALLARYKKLKHIDVRVVTPKGQSAARATPWKKNSCST